MGKNNQQRRAAKARQRRRQAAGTTRGTSTRGTSPWGTSARPSDREIEDLLDEILNDPYERPFEDEDEYRYGDPLAEPYGAYEQPAPPRRTSRLSAADEALALMTDLARCAATYAADSLDHVVHRSLDDQPTAVLVELEKLMVGEIRARLSAAWERGWRPRDLRHAAGKHTKAPGLMAAAIVDQARFSGAFTKAPESWQRELHVLTAEGEGAAVATRIDWRPAGASGYQEYRVWTDLLLIVKLLANLMPVTRLGPPPSQWGKAAPVAARSGDADRDRMLAKIRALLAKAESTEYAAEAETFTAKAQELMTRHAIDEALLHHEQVDQIEVGTIRIPLQAPYTSVKASLLDAVARPNRCRAVFIAEYDLCDVVGTPLDLDQVEMLFTSLLIQATRAMAEAGNRPAGSFDRSASFRRSFLSAYATRIGQRLEDANRDTTASYGAELVPVLQRQTEAVTEEFERLFPRTKQMRSRYVDRRGWEAGTAAADQARLTAGRITA